MKIELSEQDINLILECLEEFADDRDVNGLIQYLIYKTKYTQKTY